MPSIITGTVVLLAIAGLVTAQHRRRLEIDFDLSHLHDLAPGMGDARATAFIDNICHGDTLVGQRVKGAINVETNETMFWDDYIRGPGLNGDMGYQYAMYPWSIVSGYCQTVLNNTYVTNRDDDYGPWVDNISKWDAQTRVAIAMDFVSPKTTSFTTLPSWVHPNHFLFMHFFMNAEPWVIASGLSLDMAWAADDHTLTIRQEIPIAECTQARLTAVSVTRTLIGMQTFKIESYQWARREIREVQRSGSRTGEVEWEWYTVQGQSGMRLRWVDLRQDPGNGWVTWKDRPDHAEWKEVYSGDGYVRIDGLCMMLPNMLGPDEYKMVVNVQYQSLPPERCS
jgi:hypothetical protein